MIYLAILLAVAQAQSIKILTITKATYSDPACTTRFVLNATDPWIAQKERGVIGMVQCEKNYNTHCSSSSAYGFAAQTCTCAGTLGQIKPKGVATGPAACGRANTCWDTTMGFSSGPNRRIYLGESFACEDVDYRAALAEWNYVLVQNGTCAGHGYSDVPAKSSTSYFGLYGKGIVLEAVNCNAVAQFMPDPANNCTGRGSKWADCRKEKGCVLRTPHPAGNAICQFDSSKKKAVHVWNDTFPSGCFIDSQTNTVVYNRGGSMHKKLRKEDLGTLNAVCYNAPAPTPRPTPYPSMPAPTRQPVSYFKPAYKSYDEYKYDLLCRSEAVCTDQGAKYKRLQSLCPGRKETWVKDHNRRCVARKKKKGVKCSQVSAFWCTRFSGCKQKVYGKSKCKGKHKW